MRNLILEDTCERGNTDRNDIKDNSSTCGLYTENNHKMIVDLRELLRDKISKNEIFYSYEIVSTKKSGAFYRRFV